MFDPEKVERHQGFLATQHDRTGDEMWVTTDDYDQLLELYREAIGPNAVNVLMGKRLLASGWQRLGVNDPQTP